MSRTVAIALGCGLALSLILNAFLYFQLQASPEVIYVNAPPSRAQEPPTTTQTFFFVHVSGAVVRPSVYTLAAGSRAIAAIEAAGGALADADLERTNLARVLNDGEQLHIFRRGEQASAQSPAQAQTPANSLINVNTATQAELETLPGIGPAKAAAIIAYRTQRGAFTEPAGLLNVSGIGPSTFAGLKDRIRVR